VTPDFKRCANCADRFRADHEDDQVCVSCAGDTAEQARNIAASHAASEDNSVKEGR